MRQQGRTSTFPNYRGETKYEHILLKKFTTFRVLSLLQKKLETKTDVKINDKIVIKQGGTSMFPHYRGETKIRTHFVEKFHDVSCCFRYCRKLI